MPHYKSHKVRLEPNNRQATLFAKHAGCARYAYNWALEISEKLYAELSLSLSDIDLNKMFVKMEKASHDWLYEVSKCATQQAIRNYKTAVNNFHILQKKHNYTKKKLLNKNNADGSRMYTLEGQPQKKKKNKSKDSFYVEYDGIKPISVQGNKIRLPKIGWVKLSEEISEHVSFLSCTVSRRADQWFLSYKYEFEPTQHNNIRTVGVDLGIKTLATLSTGITFESAVRYKTLSRQLRREQRKLSRQYESWKLLKDDKKPKSNNYKKQRDKISKLHKRIADHRLDGLHKLTSYLAKNHSEVVVEDLNVSGLLKNGNLARSIANGSFFEFRRQLEYKGLWYGCKVTIADRFFPSSKTCSQCGHINQTLNLKDRDWDCKNCGGHHDRDYNASVNLEQYPVKHAHKYEKKEKEMELQPIGGYAASSAVKDCGAGSSVAVPHSPAMKQ